MEKTFDHGGEKKGALRRGSREKGEKRITEGIPPVPNGSIDI